MKLCQGPNEKPAMKAQTLIFNGAGFDTRIFDFPTPSAADLTESAVFLSKEGVAYDASEAALPFSFLSMPRPHLEAELKSTVQNIFESRRNNSVSLNEHAYIPALVPGYWNYYHLLIDSLPRILLSLQTSAAARVLVTQFQAARLQRAQGNQLSQLAKVFGLHGCLEIADGDLLHLKRAIIPKQKVRFIAPVIRIFQDVGARFCDGNVHRRIYVSRKLTTARRVINDDAVVEVLRDSGFDIVYLEQMPLAEQIRIFRESDVVIGPHGAGLANIVFSNHGTTLIEFLQESGSYKMPVFSELAALTQGKHIVLPTKPETNPQHPDHSGNMDMTVDCIGLRNALRSSLG
jgi:Glycosyltransferase 61